MATPAPVAYTAVPAVAVKEIGVIRSWRGKGVARRIHDGLLATRKEPYATLMVNPAAGDGKVQRLYEGWGYTVIGNVQPSPESPTEDLSRHRSPQCRPGTATYAVPGRPRSRPGNGPPRARV